MDPEERLNLVTTFEPRHKFIRKTVAACLDDTDHDLEEEDSSSSFKPPLNWTFHLTEEGAERVPFHQHLLSQDAHKAAIPLTSESTLANLPSELQLPPELQSRILDFGSDRMTLFHLMHTSSFLRAEASKLFWADPHTYYSVDATWLLAGGHPGHVGYKMSFLSKVQNIEIDYTVDADSYIEPRGDTSSTQSSDDLLKSFWEVLEKLFPNVRRVVLYQTSARNICFKSKGLPARLLRLWKACPPSVEATAFVAWAGGGPVFRRGRIRANGESMTIERSLFRLSDKGALEKVASRRKYQTVMIPMRTFDGPIGRFEKAKFIDERIQLQRRGLGATMIEALDRHHFDEGGPGPFDCPMRYCHEHFTEPGQWTFHAALEHVNDLIPGRQFDGWPEELRQMFRRRHIELYRLKEKIDMNVKRIQREWDDADDDKRKEIKEAWMEQLSNDPDWDTGVPAEDSSLWKRFESWMQKW